MPFTKTDLKKITDFCVDVNNDDSPMMIYMTYGGRYGAIGISVWANGKETHSSDMFTCYASAEGTRKLFFREFDNNQPCDVTYKSIEEMLRAIRSIRGRNIDEQTEGEESPVHDGPTGTESGEEV